MNLFANEGDAVVLSQAPKPEPTPSEIGTRMREIRERRGWSLELVAGRLGMTRQNLSKYERGEARIIKRGLLTSFAEAYECHVLDLTGEPYLPVDEQSAMAHSTILPIQLALLDCTLDDVPDGQARPLELVMELDGRTKMAVWELNSLRNRFGLNTN